MRRKSVLAATRSELIAVDKLQSAVGSAALVLAARLDASRVVDAAVDSGSGMAAMAKELRMLLKEAGAGTAGVDDPVDELRQLRQARLRGA